VTVAASFHELPTVVFIGAITVVVSVGVAELTPSAPADGDCSAVKLKIIAPTIAVDTMPRMNTGKLRNRRAAASIGYRRPTV
jgi:hypothetical protein